MVHMIYDSYGHCVYNGTSDTVYPGLTGPTRFSGPWTLCYVAIDDYTAKLDNEFSFGSHAPEGAKEDDGLLCNLGLGRRNPTRGFQGLPTRQIR